jgi:alpha-glucosidase (family GH31 glycosyl hydrolase)
MQMFNIPFVGADICGFAENTTMELCTRWMQVGTLYPFSRNHNSKAAIDQEPYRWGPKITAINRASINRRYLLLPFLYTLMFHSHMRGDTVWRPLFFEFPNDQTTWDIDRQFLVGPSLLVSPVLDQGATSVKAYFPTALWFDFETGASVAAGWNQLSAPLDVLNVHIRGGSIIPTQRPALTTAAARLLPFSLIVALDATGSANGDLFVDDGLSLTSIRQSKYSFISFSATQGNTIKTVPQVLGDTKYLQPLESIRVLGISNSEISSVFVNGQALPTSAFSFDEANAVRFIVRQTLAA